MKNIDQHGKTLSVEEEALQANNGPVQHSSGVQVVKSQQDLLDVILHLNIPKLFPVPKQDFT